MKKLKLSIPCAHCNKKIKLSVNKLAFSEWVKGKHVQDAFPSLSPEMREMFISRTCPKCWTRIFGCVEENNPKTKEYLFDDAVRMAEYRFRKPYREFNEEEIKYLHKIYSKADNDRLSLKVLPDRGDAAELPDFTPDFVELPSEGSGLTFANPKRSVDYKWFLVDKAGDVLSGWEYKSDAQDAVKEEAVEAFLRHSSQVKKGKLKEFMERNELESEENPSFGVEDDRPIVLEPEIGEAKKVVEKIKPLADLDEKEIHQKKSSINPKNRYPWNKEKRNEEFSKDYLSYMSPKDLAEKYGIAESFVNILAKRLGINTKRKPAFNAGFSDDYISGMSIYKIANKYNLSKSYVKTKGSQLGLNALRELNKHAPLSNDYLSGMDLISLSVKYKMRPKSVSRLLKKLKIDKKTAKKVAKPLSKKIKPLDSLTSLTSFKNDVLNGATIEQLAKKYGFKTPTIKHYIKAIHASKLPYSSIDEAIHPSEVIIHSLHEEPLEYSQEDFDQDPLARLDIQAISELYQNGKNVHQIAGMFDVEDEDIIDVLVGTGQVSRTRRLHPNNKEYETIKRRAIRSAERKFKKKEKNFTNREWQYVAGAMKKMGHI